MRTYSTEVEAVLMESFHNSIVTIEIDNRERIFFQQTVSTT